MACAFMGFLLNGIRSTEVAVVFSVFFSSHGPSPLPVDLLSGKTEVVNGV